MELGTASDFIFGFALGFFFGIVMILWTWNPASPRFQKFGIMLGVLAHVFINFMEEIGKEKNVDVSQAKEIIDNIQNSSGNSGGETSSV
ncbi:hypothetical protein MHBO_005184 [Bonamia ostreae]|uniref:DSC E3 ubiquitin ligase complex subunit 3 C-terminal domain-containing protein n=1 Tax=Bonamia ostreae TaxID=126728 RepID=A0ABV2AWH4_9EUKA